ncbi:MAG: hypothetical protein OXI22_02825 [Defluviicoccus sp.]|nr:hypothetical protein [Defluviicoccus sp.]MDE0382793.1 hypothetical protein [Defluviicoccus sp.]
MTNKKPIENASFLDVALSTFSNAPQMEQKIRSLKTLMRGGTVHSVRNDPRFAKGIEQTIEELRSTPDPRQALLALTVLTRVASRVKNERKKLIEEIEQALQSPLPQLAILDDADDRAYAAQALKWATGDWVLPYIAQAIVHEEAGEKTRSELIRILLNIAPDLTTAFQALRKPLEVWQPETESPGDSAAKRLKRIFVAIRRELLLQECPPGDELGAMLQGLVLDTFRTVGAPSTPSVAAEITSEVALVLHALVRTRFSLAVDGATYGVMHVLARWFLKGMWPEVTKPSLNTLSHDIVEAITLLAKQGITDDQLLHCLVLFEGSQDNAIKRTRAIADHLPGLPNEIAQWLRKGRVRKHAGGADLLAASSQMAADPDLALLLVDSRRVMRMIEETGQDLLNEVRVFEPALESSTMDLLKMVESLADGVRALASKRNLQIRGQVGDVVEYSPSEHVGVGGRIFGARRVRILRPLVERVRSENVSEVIIRAVVEPA